MAWITITPEDVRTRLTAAELAAIQNTSLAPDQADPVPEVIEQVVDEVRGYVSNVATLGSGSTIPSKLLSAALAIIRYRLLGRVGLKSGEDRRREYEDAVRLLERAADGKFRVEEPETASTETNANPLPSSFTTPERKFSRNDQDGI